MTLTSMTTSFQTENTLTQTSLDRQFFLANLSRKNWDGKALGHPVFPEPPTMPGI